MQRQRRWQFSILSQSVTHTQTKIHFDSLSHHKLCLLVCLPVCQSRAPVLSGLNRCGCRCCRLSKAAAAGCCCCCFFFSLHLCVSSCHRSLFSTWLLVLLLPNDRLLHTIAHTRIHKHKRIRIRIRINTHAEIVAAPCASAAVAPTLPPSPATNHRRSSRALLSHSPSSRVGGARASAQLAAQLSRRPSCLRLVARSLGSLKETVFDLICHNSIARV